MFWFRRINDGRKHRKDENERQSSKLASKDNNRKVSESEQAPQKKTKKGKSHNSNISRKCKEPTTMTPNEKIAVEWYMAFKTRDRSRLEAVTDLGSRFVMKDQDAGDFEFRVQDLYDVASNFWEAVPNCDYEFTSIKEVSPGTVLLTGFSWFGNHTGVPYLYEPHPPIEPEGTYVKDGPLDCTFTIENGRIMKTVTRGRSCGPHGTYEKLGGILF